MAFLYYKAALVLFFGLVFVAADNTSKTDEGSKYPFGDVRNCPTVNPVTGEPLYRMEVLPGLGFDNLRNYEMSQVVQYNYSTCKTTNDGRLLIPDDVITVPIQRSRLQTYSEVYQHWDNYTSMTSSSINFDASFFSVVSGKFGFEYQHVKQHQVNNKAQTTRIQLRNTLYKITLEPDAQLNPRFKNRLLDIAANIQSNNTEYARFLSELLVRDYGTHILRSVEAGAVISQIDSISSQYISDMESSSSSVSASASANFMSKFSFGLSSGYSNGEVDQSKYIQNRYHSQVMSIGGPSVTVNMSINEWEKGVLNSMVPIDRAGDPIHYVITTTSLPELPDPTLRELVDYVFTGAQMYYSINTHHGCTDPSSPNFDFEANLNDGSCAALKTDFAFGGIYQTCDVKEGYDYENLCTKGTSTVNPLTGDYTCPAGYQALQLHTGTVTHVSKKEVCDKVCHHSGVFGWGRSCQCLTAWIDVLSAAEYQAYWCVATGEVPDNSGYLFGGVYTSKTVNPVTKSMSCPNHFLPLHIGEDMEVCVSDQYDIGYEYSIPFAGFFSCKIGNPLAQSPNTTTNMPKTCPKTYTRVMATVDEGCEITYCAKFQSDYAIKPPKLPPFHKTPGVKLNLTQAMVIQGPYGDIWVRNEQGGWERANEITITGAEVLEQLSDRGISTPTNAPTTDKSGGQISPVVSAVISSIVTIFVCTLIVLAVFGIYGAWKRKKKGSHQQSSSHYSAINETDSARPVDDSAMNESLS